MRRSKLLALRDPQWIPVPPDKTLEVQVIPSAAGLAIATFLSTREDAARRMCLEAFTDFRGYIDDAGQSIANTLEARLELYGWQSCRGAIHQKLQELSEQAAEGEDGAASG